MFQFLDKAGCRYLQLVGTRNVERFGSYVNRIVSLEYPWSASSLTDVILGKSRLKDWGFFGPDIGELIASIDGFHEQYGIPRIGHTTSDNLELLETSAQGGMRPEDIFRSQKPIVPDSYGSRRVPTVIRNNEPLFDPLCKTDEDALAFLEALLSHGRCSGIFHLQPWRANKEDVRLLRLEVVARRMNELQEYLWEGDSSDYLYSWVLLIARWAKDQSIERVTFVHELSPMKLRYLRAIVLRTNQIFEQTGLRVISE
jgi:hypothetical protein